MLNVKPRVPGGRVLFGKRVGWSAAIRKKIANLRQRARCCRVDTARGRARLLKLTEVQDTLGHQDVFRSEVAYRILVKRGAHELAHKDTR